jgi:citrate synthase
MSIGRPFSYPDMTRPYTNNFLYMLKYMNQQHFEVSPVLTRVMDTLFILHADHEQNCSTTTMRSVGSGHADPYSSMSAAAAALYGPLHGGANEKVVNMLTEIGHSSNIPAYIERVKRGELRLMGFGHRVYKNYDPRARIIKQAAYDVFEITGTNPLIDIAVELERIALNDEYFISRKLYPNVDFYSGIIYQAMGLPVGMFPALFAIPRAAGWLAQWLEMHKDPEQRIARPRQVYLGCEKRSYLPIDQRQ